ncbi:PilW family protein [Tolumonas lignilytica]|uniref:PilW family protein n=1 Tax=Tolumonas lignilytica TaxID=1283284 RepID=UPI000466C474|nr:PilW family protein [Tolumonas lignilytica]
MKKQTGFTLLEWMIALTIGLFLLAGMMSLYSASHETTNDSLDSGELQENGRIAMNLLMRDLHMADFWGDYTGSVLSAASGANITLSSAASNLSAANDCLDDRNAGSFPVGSNNLRPVWTVHVNHSGSKGTVLGCISNTAVLSPDSDIINIKRLRGEDASNLTLDNDHFYMATTVHAGYFFKGNETAPTAANMPNRRIWEYLNHLYFIRVTDNIPELHMTYLLGSMTDSALVQGVEKMRLLFMVDTTFQPDGIVDQYITPENITQQEWDEGRVLGVRLFLLVRSLQPSPLYTNTNTYQLGDISYTPTTDDHFRRLLLQSTVKFNNGGLYIQ